MAIYKKRFAPVQDLILVFAACAFVVYSWSIFYFFERLPAWLYYLDLWEIAGIFAYAQVFALIESAVILLVLMLVAALLPSHLFRDKFVTIGTFIVLLISACTVLAQSYDHVLRDLSTRMLLVWLLPTLIVMVVLYLVVYQQPRLQALVHSFAERLSVLLYIYIPLSLIGMVIVIARNVI